MQYPVIVVAACNRTSSLKRLLHSLLQASYPDGKKINLVISIDFSENDDVFHVAEDLTWVHGEKQIITHSQKLGLRKHIIQCGDLTSKHESIILLEDDLLVAPGFYKYACSVISHFNNNSDIAGYSLYHYSASESTGLPFELLNEGFDNYFMMVPSSWGEIWTKQQWAAFRDWYSDDQSVSSNDCIPENVISWPESSWKKYFCKYLVVANKYFVYPTCSYTTNSGASGTHHQKITHTHQAPLSLKEQNFTFASLHETINVYDQFFELVPSKINSLKEYNGEIEIDINGCKPLNRIRKKYMVSTKMCRNPIVRFPLSVFPLPINLISPSQLLSDGPFLSLGCTRDFEDTINPDALDFIAKRTSGHILERITLWERGRISKSDEFVIGTKMIKLLNKLPSLLRRMLLKTRIFRNPWNTQ